MAMTSLPEPLRKFGPITLAAGGTPAQIFVFIAVVVCAVCMLNTIPLMKVYVFGELMGIPKAEQGRLTGNLATIQQVAVLIFIGLAGVLADRWGRRAVLMMAMVGYVLCLSLYPLATGIPMLFALHFLLGVSSTGHTAGGGTLMADYPHNSSRGKFIGMMLVLQALASAVLVSWLGARIPGWLTASGMPPAQAGRYAFWALAMLGVLGIAIALLWFKEPLRQARPPSGGLLATLRSTRADFGRLWAYAQTNPRFALVMTMGCVIRSDYVVIGAFLSLWVMHGATAQGLPAGEALKTAGLLTATLQIAAVASPALIGVLADRVDRTVMLVVSLAATGLALCSTALISDVLGPWIFVVVALIGVTEYGLIIAAQSVFGEQAPPDLRGSGQGLFALFGTLSVVLVSWISGVVYDQVSRVAPFVMVGLLNLSFALLGAYLLIRQRRRDA